MSLKTVINYLKGILASNNIEHILKVWNSIIQHVCLGVYKHQMIIPGVNKNA